jgi:RNA polymerase sigma-70 factor (ECF subfamily)
VYRWTHGRRRFDPPSSLQRDARGTEALAQRLLWPWQPFAAAEVAMLPALLAPPSPAVRTTGAPLRSAPSPTRQKKLRYDRDVLPHVHALYGAAMRYTRSSDDANDLVQETLFKAWRSYESFTEGTNCKAWLFRILTNTFINKYRRSHKERDIVEGKGQLGAEHELVHIPSKQRFLDPEGALADGALADEVQAALAALPVDFRTVVVLSDIEGFAYKEVADIAGIPVGTVMSRLFRGRRLLQEALFGYAVEQGVLHPTLDAGREGRSEPLSLDDYRKRRARTAEVTATAPTTATAAQHTAAQHTAAQHTAAQHASP